MKAGGRRHRLGNGLVLALLLGAAGWLAGLHAGPWWPGPALGTQWQAAFAALLAYGLLCAGIAWPRRPRRARTETSAPVLVAWASQTGFACELADRSVAALAAAGVEALALPLQDLDVQHLRQTPRILFIASTTGEGDPPDHALAFLRRTASTASGLSSLRYGVLALGDRDYEDFCAFGRWLDEWLSAQGAHALFDRVEVDNADAGALRHWQYLLSQLGDGVAGEDWAPPHYRAWRLGARERSNPGCEDGAAYRISLQPADEAWPDWQAGDIAEIGPCHAEAAVDQWLRVHGLEGDLRIGESTLRQWLARSHWPSEPPAAEDVQAQAFVASLQALPHREYSIASLPAERRLDLLVRYHHGPDGRPGLGSGWLCEHAAIGAPIALRIRANPGFHPPEAERPMILIGNGTGVAGLRAHLAARIAAGARRNWLLVGERHAAHDAHYGEQLRRWQEAGGIERLDAVYSRDAGAHRYVQDRLRAETPRLREWVADGAAIYVCGSLRGMAPAVDQVIEQALGAPLREQLLAQGRYRRDVY